MIFKQKKLLSFILVCFTMCSSVSAEEQAALGNFNNPSAVKEVLSDKRKIANAAWWGFNKKDSTTALQGAIDSGASKVIVPYMGSDWVVRPIRLASNQEIVFEPGVVVMAKKGEFKGKNDCLFSAISKKNITLRGYGAVLSMRKKDYMRGEYIKSEFRHGLALRSCSDITILGLTIKDTGGDGIYVSITGAERVPCRNILVRDCICDGNYRQGMSVISAENLRVENCVFKNTKGTRPSAGIDIEPSNAKDSLVNIIVSNCIADNNAGAGFEVNLSRLSVKSLSISILFVNCYVRSGYGPGLMVLAEHEKNHSKGLIEFKNCVCENITYAGAYLRLKSDSTAQVRFNNCKWRNVATRRTIVPISLVLRRSKVTNQTEGIEFLNSYVYDEKNRPFLKISDVEPSEGVYNVTGNISVSNPYGAKTDLSSKNKAIGLEVTLFSQKQE